MQEQETKSAYDQETPESIAPPSRRAPPQKFASGSAKAYGPQNGIWQPRGEKRRRSMGDLFEALRPAKREEFGDLTVRRVGGGWPKATGRNPGGQHGVTEGRHRAGKHGNGAPALNFDPWAEE